MIERILFVPVVLPAPSIITTSGRLKRGAKVILVETRRAV